MFDKEVEYIKEALNNMAWEVSPSEGFPGCTRFSFSDDMIEYDRFNHAKAEPLVFIRDYNGFREQEIEIAEEFRFFHNLYYDN